jgi:hypothetical protein
VNPAKKEQAVTFNSKVAAKVAAATHALSSCMGDSKHESANSPVVKQAIK